MPHPRRTAAPMQGPAAWGSRTPPAARLRGLCPTAGQRAGQAACSGRGCCGRAPDAPPAPAGAGLCCGQTSHRDTAGLPAAGGAVPPGYCTSTTALPLNGSCRAKPVSWKACTGSCTPATSSVAGTLGAPLRPKQYSRARSTAYTPAQLASSRPGDSGRLTLRLRLCTPGSTTAPHKSRLSSAYQPHSRQKLRPGTP